MATYELEFYEDERGDRPVLRWTCEELTFTQRYELGQAMRGQLQEKGVGVCATDYGKQLGKGLFEFRLRRSVEEVGERILLRVFCHAYGNKVVLLLGGYDKGADPSARRQDDEIALARHRLANWKRRRT
ncbi:MAG TPA: hypothetical protein VFR85_18985 [Anaeromyxobacteraceae bacterium]|nr:hypothetical protein [Anaeromyxobacteraceae bacterium]